jgi:hypothetical protein
VELKKIEREFDGLPPEPSSPSGRAKLEWARREEEQRHQRSAAIGVYVRLALVVALVISIGSWPYARTCGMPLFLYMASVSAVIIGGIWIAVSTWLNRMPRTHLLAIFIVFWGLTLSAVEVLPRAGYAQPDPLREVWSCG